jgi:hypothetical protein
MKPLLSSLVTLGLLTGTVTRANADYLFTTIDIPGSPFTQATGINNLGQMVVRGSAGSFLLSGGTYTLLLRTEKSRCHKPLGKPSTSKFRQRPWPGCSAVFDCCIFL